MSSADNYADVYDRNQWPEVEMDESRLCGGRPQAPGLHVHLHCPLSTDPSPEDLENYCLRNCRVNRRYCAGFSGGRPLSRQGAKIEQR